MNGARAHFLPAHAKINLTLDVLGKRSDGYHELASVMQTISLADTLLVKPAAAGSITCETDVPALRTEQNLALRAARRLAQQLGERAAGARIELRKSVPSQGGLGGGSGDAAAVLVALNALWGGGLDAAALESLAAELGSDVPFFVRGGTCLVEGRGERVTPLPDAEPLWLLVAKPPVNISTSAVFRALAPDEWTNGEDTVAVVASIRQGQPLPFERLSNALETSVFRGYGTVAATRDALLAAGAPVVRMSGSGPTLYAPFRSLLEASAVYHAARARKMLVWLCHTVSRADVARARSG